jgi:hypothetical protein
MARPLRIELADGYYRKSQKASLEQFCGVLLSGEKKPEL